MSRDVLLNYQSATLQAIEEFPVVVIEKSRRIGESWAVSFIADIMAARSDGMDVFYVGYNHDMSREFIDYCADHARLMQGVVDTVQESFWNDPAKEEKDIKVFRIDFASGYKVQTLPSRPRALRGMQGLVIIDEAAFHDDLAELLKAALALLMWGGKVVVISTHDGEMNPFNELVNKIRAGRLPYHLMRITLDDALADGLYRRICSKLGQIWSIEAEEKWRADTIAFYDGNADEELFCIPSQGSGAYLPLALIEARSQLGIPVIRWKRNDEFMMFSEHVRFAGAEEFCRDNIRDILNGLPNAPYVMGGDFARSGDLAVFWFLEIAADMGRKTAFVLELRNIPFEQQKQILHYCLDRLPEFRAGKMDARGNGQYLAEVTVQRYGSRVEAVMTSENWYRDNMPPLKAAFEDGTLVVPSDREIIDDIRSLQLVRGVARIPEKRTRAESGNRHSDAAIALCFAYQASRSDIMEYGFAAIPYDYTTAENRKLSDDKYYGLMGDV